MTKSLKLFWHVFEVLMLLAGYVWLWTFAFGLLNEADTLAYIVGLVLILALIAAPVAIGRTIYARLRAHFEEST